MHTRLRRTSLVALALAAVLSAACTKSRENPAATGTTGSTAGVRVSQIDMGRSLTADKTINDKTDSFKPNDTIYASVLTEGAAARATLKARWTYQDGQAVTESTQTIAPTAESRTEFHISKPDGWPTGKYKLEVFLNDSTAGTKEFDVQR
jgi:nitrogen fixation/metabolism regulation signal transduction histidine kinase